MEITFKMEKCPVCGGKGLVPNPYFEFGAKLGKAPQDMGGCSRCEFRDLCYRGELVICEECDGSGIKLIPTGIKLGPIPRTEEVCGDVQGD